MFAKGQIRGSCLERGPKEREETIMGGGCFRAKSREQLPNRDTNPVSESGTGAISPSHQTPPGPRAGMNKVVEWPWENGEDSQPVL